MAVLFVIGLRVVVLVPVFGLRGWPLHVAVVVEAIVIVGVIEVTIAVIAIKRPLIVRILIFLLLLLFIRFIIFISFSFLLIVVV